MARIVYFCERGGLPLAGELERAGHVVFEALAISEVLNLIEHENIDLVILESSISPERRQPIDERIATIRLTEQTTPTDLVFEISHLFPSRTAVQ